MKARFIELLGAGAIIWMIVSAYRPSKKRQRLQIITSKNRVFMIDSADEYYNLGLPRDETIKSMKWVSVG